MATALIKTTCSDCSADLVIDPTLGEVSTRIASNGLRGSKHIAAYDARADVFDNYGDGTLLVWDCPACEYPDSYDMTA